MRGLYTPITQIRREVFISVARAAYENLPIESFEDVPYEIIQGEVPQYRDSVYKERAIVTERIRLALGQGLRPAEIPTATVTTGITAETLEDPNFDSGKLYVIPAACDACEEKSYFVTSCHNCIAHTCMNICPVGAMGYKNNRAEIDQDLCIKCGKCYNACKYHAIIKNERPCIAACGSNAMIKDSLNRGFINHDKCVT
ncbi:MAG: 4Fe-4S binding protein, partial [Erysipelotrichales bacterium]|nr:4Fe-4S binding protein [Erysipelotrichales bacterium]